MKVMRRNKLSAVSWLFRHGAKRDKADDGDYSISNADYFRLRTDESFC